MKNLKSRSGFTLIEMLIVVGIIGILVVIAVPALSTSISDARKAKQDAYISQLNTALNRFIVDNEVAGTYNATCNIAGDGTAVAATIGKYLTINGQTGSLITPDVLKSAICNGASLTISGGKVNAGSSTGAMTLEPVTGIQCGTPAASED